MRTETGPTPPGAPDGVVSPHSGLEPTRMRRPLIARFLFVTLAAAFLSGAAADGHAAIHEHVVTVNERDLTFSSADGYVVVRLEGADLVREPGLPELPVVPVTIALPGACDVLGVSVRSAETTELLRRARIRPAQPPAILPIPGRDVALPSFVAPDPSVYGTGSPWPENPVDFNGTGHFSGRTLVDLAVRPLQYIPSDGKLRLFTRLVLEIEYEGTDTVPDLGPHPATTRTLTKVAANGATLPAGASSRPGRDSHLTPGDHEYVIVCGSGYVDIFQPLADWKTRKGVPATTVEWQWIDATYDGADGAERLRNFIIDARATWGTVWFLLGGEPSLVPVRRAYAMTSEAGMHADEDALACDLYLSDLDGDWNADGDDTFGEIEDAIDLYPDVYVGRASVKNTAQAEAFVEKTLRWERDPLSGYQLDMLMAAEVLWSDPFTDSGIALNWIDNESIPPRYDPITKLYETLGNESGASVTDALNAGPGHFLHSGHAWYTTMGCGDGAIYRWEIYDLTNADEQPLVYSIGCWPAAFDLTDECIAERFIGSPNGGAVAFIGNSRYGWASPGNPGYGYSERFMQAFYRAVFVDGLSSAGQALAAAKASMVPLSRAENVYRWHQYEVNLLGDPELPVWTDVPRPLTVSHPDTLPAGQSILEVAVRSSQGPVEGALVCAMNGLDAYERGHTDQSGSVLLPLNLSTPDSVSITVTAPDHMPYEGVIPVAVSGAFLRVASHETDDSVGGNGDGLAGPGETVEVTVSLENVGTETADAADLTVAGDDPWVSVATADADLPPVDPGETSSPGTPFVLTVLPEAPDGHVATFDVTATDSRGSSWVGSFNVTVAAPRLVAGLYSIDDAVGGDGDGILEPGESAALMVDVTNLGGAVALDPLATAWTFDDEILLVDDSADVGDIGPQETGRPVFSLDVDEHCAPTHVAEVVLEFETADGFTDIDTLHVAVGTAGIEDDFESGAPGWSHGGANDLWTLSELRARSGSMSWYCGDPATAEYTNNMDASLISPEVVLGEESELAFWAWCEFPIYHEDGLFVELVGTDGAVDTLDFIGSGGALGELGSIGNDWLEYRYAGLGEPGDTVRVRFRFHSDGSEVVEGVHIDDVSIVTVSGSTGTSVPGGTMPEPMALLHQNSPNPFTPSTTIRFTTPSPGHVVVAVYNVQGRLIKTLLDDYVGAGEHAVVWDGRDELGGEIAAGVYLYRLSYGGREESRKMLLVR
ncbi:MAG: T9SS type A sorting domain-containing protein [Candidatus Eisenbacteria bacterium]|nr:T9SS type A sorting domain-containing protein [Candidatus Eisenbacteria bacterium]